MTQRLDSMRNTGFGPATLSSSGPGGNGDDLPVLALLERYATSTAIAPRADLTARIAGAMAAAPDATPPRRYLWALRDLDPRAAARAFRAMLDTLAGSSRARTAVRAQSLAFVMATLLTGGTLAAAGTSGVLDLLRRSGPEPNLPAVVEPSPSATLPALLPNGDSSPSPAWRTLGPNESPAPAATAADETTEPGLTFAPPPEGASAPPDATPTGADQTDRPGDPTSQPTVHPTAGTTDEPQATDPPAPTNRPTPRPTARPTEKPDQTDPPGTERPEQTDPPETQEPQKTDPPETQEPDQTDGSGDGGSGGDSGHSDPTAAPGTDDGGDGSLPMAFRLFPGWVVW